MKKLKLSLQNIEGAEVLTRQQLKMVMGGDWGSGDENQQCKCKDGQTAGIKDCDEGGGLDACKKFCEQHDGFDSCKPFDSI